jgi:hypothetical protein
MNLLVIEYSQIAHSDMRTGEFRFGTIRFTLSTSGNSLDQLSKVDPVTLPEHSAQ